MRELTRAEIVGAKIRNIWQTEWNRWSEYPDERLSCESFVETGNGCFFKLGEAEVVWDEGMENILRTSPIHQLEKNDLGLIPGYCAAGEGFSVAGLRIMEVVAANVFGAPGLILEENTLLLADAYGPAFKYFGMIAYPLGDFFKSAEMFDYWSLSRLEKNYDLADLSATPRRMEEG